MTIAEERRAVYDKEEAKALKGLRKGDILKHVVHSWGDADFFKVIKIDRKTGVVSLKFFQSVPGM